LEDTTFFLQDNRSYEQVFAKLEIFYSFSSLILNRSKSEAGWLGSKIDEEIGQSGIQYIDFEEEGFKILGIIFTYNKESYFKNYLQRVLTHFNTILSIWKTRTLYGKIQVLRSLALPKLYYVCTKTYVTDLFMKTVENTIKDFIWNGKKPKIKQNTLIGEYQSIWVV
jgi:hypothetical protein